MTTAHVAARPGAARLRTAIAARAVVAAALAVAVTFNPDHTTGFGLLVLGLFEPAQALVLLLGLRTAGRRGRLPLAIRCALLAVIGVLALVLPGALRTQPAHLLLLVVLEGAAFAVGGALELAGGLARGEAPVQRRDAVTMGGLQLVAAAMLAVLNPDPVFAVGVLGAWAAIVAVYLGIAAASIGRQGVR